MTNPWDKIFTDNFEAAYKIADKNYSQSSQDFDLRAKAICSLLLRKYDNSLIDFLALNEIEKQTNRISDGTYMEIALCYYALGDIEKAIDYFKFPVVNRKDIKYTGDISIPPSILFYIGIKLSREDVLKVATKELKRSKQKIPSFLLGQTSTIELNAIYEEQTHEILRNRKYCQVEFYKAVAELANGRPDKYLENLNRCVDIKGHYLEFEYYLAKVELDKINSR